MEKKYNYTYQIKNLLNGKTYIGVHSTDDIDDGYMGSGVRLKQSMEKHGIENFVKTIMCFFDTSEEAYKEEEFLVDEKWVESRDNYNVCLGGLRGPVMKGKDSPFYGIPKTNEIKKKISESKKEYYISNDPWNKGIERDVETLIKMSKNRNRKTDLPMWVYYNKREGRKKRYCVRIKRKSYGMYYTLQEALEVRNKYLIENGLEELTHY